MPSVAAVSGKRPVVKNATPKRALFLPPEDLVTSPLPVAEPPQPQVAPVGVMPAGVIPVVVTAVERERCVSCNHPNLPGSSFCGMCGKKKPVPEPAFERCPSAAPSTCPAIAIATAAAESECD